MCECRSCEDDDDDDDDKRTRVYFVGVTTIETSFQSKLTTAAEDQLERLFNELE